MNTNTPAVPEAAPAPAVPKQRRQRLAIRLTTPLLRRLREFAAAKGRPPSKILEDVVAAYLAGGGSHHSESAAAAPIDQLVEALDAYRAERTEQHLQVLGSNEVLVELVREFLWQWLLLNAAALEKLRTKEERDQVWQVADARYRRILKGVAARLHARKRLVDELPPPEPNPIRSAMSPGG